MDLEAQENKKIEEGITKSLLLKEIMLNRAMIVSFSNVLGIKQRDFNEMIEKCKKIVDEEFENLKKGK